MATLVLNVVGSVIGGPIGAAIGSIVGQAIDRNVLFKPKGREGPRLTELAVQTSSYGTQIPLVFGRLRVAGTVIWATDLMESKSRSGGKGQPSITNYSYSASFAVLLSGRPITDVGRIWADGKLLRGAEGDFKTATGFRLHLGGAGQSVDPLIASVEGAAMTPAMRGMAYAVFENFQLADYGNRIPSLTFEVIAEPGPVSVGSIVAAVSGGQVDGGDVSQPLHGFSAYGDTVRGVLETLALAGNGWFAPSGAGLVLRDATTPGFVLSDPGASAGGAGSARRARSIAAIESVPRTVSITHYDPARDYQAGLQRVRRPGAGNRSERIELPAAVDGATAKAIARRSLATREAARERRQIALGWDAIDRLPGDLVTIAGEPGNWRLTGWSLEQMVLTLELIRLPGEGDIATDPGAGGEGASSGRVLADHDIPQSPTLLHIFELPTIDDTVATMPRLYVAASGVGASAGTWRRAALFVSTDNGARWASAGTTALPAVIGALVAAPGPGPATLWDLNAVIEVELADPHQSLAGADDIAIDGGANLALVGEELVQFGRAEQVSPVRWRLSRLLRGRRGTEAAIGRQAAGDRFVLIDAATLATIDLPVARIGSTVRVMASGVGDTLGPVAASALLHGIAVRPPAPVKVAASPLPDGGVALRWTRRSRGGWRWTDGGDSPLVEEREAYRVTIAPAAGLPRFVETTEPILYLSPAEWTGAQRIQVAQLGTTAESPDANLDL